MIKGIKGVKDILPEETPRWRFIEETARQWADRYGFHEIRIPIFEVTTLFARSIGATTDIVKRKCTRFPIVTERLSRSDRKAPQEPSVPSSNITEGLIRSRKNIFTSAPCFAMNGRKLDDSVNFISLVSNIWGPRILRRTWTSLPVMALSLDLRLPQSHS